MSSESTNQKNRINMPEDDFPDPSDAELAAIVDSAETRDDVRAAIARPTNGRRNGESADVSESLTGLGLLTLGGLAYVSELLHRHLAESKVAIERDRRTGIPKTLPPDDEMARYALMGLALKAPSIIEAGVSRAGNVVNTVGGVATSLVSPIANSFLFRPIRERYDAFADRGENMIEELAVLGMQGEQYGKEMVETATLGTVTEVVDVIVESEEVRELVQQQTVGLAQEFLMFVQDRLESADLALQRIAFRIIPGDQSDRKVAPMIEIPRPVKNRALILSADPSRRTP